MAGGAVDAGVWLAHRQADLQLRSTNPLDLISISDPAVTSELESQGIKLAPGNLLASARRVIAGDPTGTQAFREGRVAIQDEASQLVALLLGEGSRILDCCAAPGGKTRLLAERNPRGRHRCCGTASAPRPAASQAGSREECANHRRRHPRSCPPADLFDRVLVDVPCSGTGTLVRNPEIKWRLKPEDLLDLQTRQLAILQSAMQRVAPGGRLVYSTCSLEPEENQSVVESALSHDSSFRPEDCRERLNDCALRENWLGKILSRSPPGRICGPFPACIPVMASLRRSCKRSDHFLATLLLGHLVHDASAPSSRGRSSPA